MDWFQIVMLALIQGVTEFLPISSSAHLILLPHVFGWADQGLAFDLAVHLGTLLAVIGYFYSDLRLMLKDWTNSLLGGPRTPHAYMAWGVGLATIPAVLFGAWLGVSGESQLRQPWVIAFTSIGFGVLLGWADYRARQARTEAQLGLRGYVMIGLAQALALIPGASRSGMTITGGLLLGLTRKAAARISFFMAVPITLAAIMYETMVLVTNPQPEPWLDLGLAALFAFVSALAAIHLFLRMLDRIGMMPFVIYRIVLGVVLLAVFGFG
jgi:undecaprenyl-diphosphatase